MHRVLIIGTGSIGERHVRCFQNTGRAEVGICEIKDDLRRRIAEQYHVEKAIASLDEALRTRWDCAVIATPAPTHIPLAARLADAGVHPLIEKPLSVSLEGVEELIRSVNRLGLVAAVAYVYRAHPALAAMREAIRAGRFGKPLQIVVAAGQHFPYYRPAYRETYYARRETGGGAIQDALTHLLNAGEWLLGPIDRLVADAGRLRLEGVEVEDTVHLIARHGPVMASYSLNQHQAPNEIVITIVCERGTARMEVEHHRWRSMTEPEGVWQEKEFPLRERDDLFIRQAHAFMDALEGKSEVLCTLEEGLQTLKVNLAALESAEKSAWQSVS